MKRKNPQMEWSARDIATLRTYYPTEGGSCAKRFPGRTRQSVYCAALRYRVRSAKPPITGPEWTADEKVVLLENYRKLGSKGTAALIPGRTTDAVRHQAEKYGLLPKSYTDRQGAHLPGRYKGRWTEAELKILREHYPTLGTMVFQMLPGRTRNACHLMARKIGIFYRGDK